MTPEELDLKNGANLIVVNERGQMLVVREKTRKKMWMLPGGAVERGECPSHAAQSETEEETGIITDDANFRFIGYFVQKPKGVVFLYETKKFRGEIRIHPDSKEVSEARFMSFEEIRGEAEAERFRTGYLRMILRYLRCVNGIDPMPYEGRLSDEVEFPADLNFGGYRDIVSSV